MAAPLRVVLVAPLSEPLTRRAISEPVVLAWELVRCLVDLQVATSSFELTVIARRDSERIAPTITLDPGELGHHESTPRSIVEESLILEFALRGGLEGYDVIHIIGPYLAPLQLLARTSALLFQTDWTNGVLPAHELASRVIATPRFQRLRIAGRPSTRLDVIRAPVDLVAHAFRDRPGRQVACITTNEEHARIARRIANELDRRLVTPLDTPADELLDDAAVLLALSGDPAPIGELWPLRAAARGILVAGWIGGPVETARWPTHSFAGVPLGDVAALVSEVRDRLAVEPREREARRVYALSHHAPRNVAARHLEAYRVLRTAVAASP